VSLVTKKFIIEPPPVVVLPFVEPFVETVLVEPDVVVAPGPLVTVELEVVPPPLPVVSSPHAVESRETTAQAASFPRFMIDALLRGA
jgi:hypothetical protein